MREYAYRKLHPVLQFLPTKFELGFPDKQDPAKWGAS